MTLANVAGKGGFLGLDESLLMEEPSQHRHQHLVDALGTPLSPAQLNTSPLGVPLGAPLPLTSPSRSSPRSQASDNGERFSRKVFVGGLPPDIDEGE